MGYFKTTADGRQLYYPWGFWGKGYLIASEADSARVKGWRKTFLLIATVLIIAAFAFQGQGSFTLYAVAVGYIGAYAVWTRFAVAGLAPTQEKISAQEIMAAHPRLYSPFLLWPLQIGALIFVLGGVVVLIKNPSDWPTALGAIVFFGLCAASFAHMLVIRASLRRSGA